MAKMKKARKDEQKGLVPIWTGKYAVAAKDKAETEKETRKASRHSNVGFLPPKKTRLKTTRITPRMPRLR